MDYNPYNLVEMKINGKPIHGRPIEFDSEITDFSKLKNAFGNYVRPKVLSTVCPDCGQGLVVTVALPDPPFPVIEHTCPYCHPYSEQVDPFQNPIDSQAISQQELDPLLHNINVNLKPTTTVVADRLPVEELFEEEPPITQGSHSLDFPVDDDGPMDEDLIDMLEGEEKQKEGSDDTKEEAEEVVEPEEEVVQPEEEVVQLEEEPIAETSSEDQIAEKPKKAKKSKKKSPSKEPEPTEEPDPETEANNFLDDLEESDDES